MNGIIRPTRAHIDKMVGEALEAAHTVIRPNVWQASLDADRLAEEVRRSAYDLVQHGDALTDHPGDPQIRVAARATARRVIDLCDQLERLA